MRAVLDTNVLLTWSVAPPEYTDLRVSALTWAEIRRGIGKSRGDGVVSKALAFQDAYNAFHAAYGSGLPFDDSCAASFDSLVELTHRAGRDSKGRVIDLMIAATAVVHGADLLTRNPRDFAGLEPLLTVVAL